MREGTEAAPVEKPRGAPGETVLELREVCFRWTRGGDLVLDTVSAAIAGGEMVGIVGPNGAGKSTLLRVCAGLLTADEGECLVSGRSLASWSRKELARKTALVPQDLSVPFSFTVEELALMGRAPHLGRLGLEGAGDIALVREILSEMDLEDLATRPVDRLSGGERQRAFIARALAQDPRILLCDEPTAHLDLRHRRRLFEALRKRVEERGIAVLVVLHDLNLAASTCDRLLLLNEGAIAAEGPPLSVLRPDVLEEVYQTPLVAGTEPETGRPYVLG